MRGMQFKGFDDWIEIFRAGTQTDSRGRARTWTPAELDQIVANHTADADKAPVVIGHPKNDSPAYGWVAGLKRAGDSLLAKLRDVEPTFAKMVAEKRFPNRSVAIVPGDNGFILRHIGWLGAAAPAIDGLKPVEFAADGEVYEYQSDDWYTPDLLSRLMRRLREWLISEKSIEAADQVIPEYLISDAAAIAESRRPADAAAPTYSAAESGHAYSHPSLPNGQGDSQMQTHTQAEFDQAIATARETARTEACAEFSQQSTELRDQLNAERRTRLNAEYQAAVTAAIDAGRLTPAQATGMVEFMLALPADDAAQFEFSTGEGAAMKTEKVAPLAWFQKHLAGLGKQITLGEHSEFRNGKGNTVDLADPEAISQAALEYQAAELAAGREITVTQAVNHVTGGK